MGNQKHIRWLYDELPGLIASNILSRETAEGLRAHYGELKPGRSRWEIAFLVFGVLGSLLIGLGIILVFAYNWDQFSRLTRTVLSFIPLLIGQILVGWALFTQRDSAAWREGSAIFLYLALGVTIGMISQIYHIESDWAKFVLTWMLLGVPLVYLLNASFPVLIYIYGITSWAELVQQGGNPHWYWLLLLIPVGHVYQAWQQGAGSLRFRLLSLIYAVSILFGLGVTNVDLVSGQWAVIYSSFLAILYLLSERWTEDSEVKIQPVRFIGLAGMLILAYMFTFDWFWDETTWELTRREFNPGQIITALIGSLVIPIGAVALLIDTFRQKRIIPVLFGSMFLITIAGFFLNRLTGQDFIPVMLFNLYLFSLGLATTVIGIRRTHMGIVNSGLGILAVLIMIRFFDSDLPILTRGIAFIIIGTGFVTGNFILARRLKSHENE